MPLAALALLNFGILTLLLLETEEAGKPSPPQAPYTPPFDGGQCDGIQYAIEIAWYRDSWAQDVYAIFGAGGGSASPSPAAASTLANNAQRFWGPIGNITHQTNLGNDNWRVTINGVSGNFYAVSKGSDFRIHRVYRIDGLADNCGDIPNPNPPLDTIPNGGYGSPPPNVEGENYDPQLLLAPVLPVGGAIAAAKAAIAAAKAAIALATSIAELANALKDFFDKQEEYEEEKEKEKEKEEEKKKRKEIWRQSLGTIRNDGILSLVPKDTNESIKLLYLEINFVNIPNSIGKYFGEYSPNRYPYGYGLGYIGFYGAGAGIRELHNMEFRRNSIRIPVDTLGFIYHLGLNTTTTANVDLVYEREVTA